MSTNGIHLSCGIALADHEQNIVYLTLPGDRKGKITFLDDGIFRYQVVQNGSFEPYASARDPEHKARIQQYPDTDEHYCKPSPMIEDQKDQLSLRVGEMELRFDKKDGTMQVFMGSRIVLEEERALELSEDHTTFFLRKQKEEKFFGGGTQNGRFVHTDRQINIVNESAWMDGGVASPNPFYYTTAGYGILRNTFSDGSYDFGCAEESVVQTTHKEPHFDAYFFISSQEDGRLVVQDLLRKYYQVTGNPLLLPEYGFYEGHLNCYNRDSWSEESGSKEWNVKGIANENDPGVSLYESGMATGYRLEAGQHAESLNGEMPCVATENFPENVDTPYKFSARAVLDQYIQYDMPLGYFLPNDGYGGGYGQNGYYKQAGKYILQYIDLIHDEMEKAGGELNIFGGPLDAKDTYLREDLFRQYEAFFEQALAAVDGDRDTTFRVKTAEMPLCYAGIVLEYGDRAEKLNRIEKFAEQARKTGLVMVEEWKITVDKFVTDAIAAL